MSSFFSSQPFKPLRQEGFSPPGQSTSNPSPPPFDFGTSHGHASAGTASGYSMPEAFRRASSQGDGNGMDFTDELVSSLIGNGNGNGPPGHVQNGSGHEPHPHSPQASNSTPGAANGYEDYRHNIFDISAPGQQTSATSPSLGTSSSFPTHFQRQQHESQSQGQPDLMQHTHTFGNPLPSLSRFDSMHSHHPSSDAATAAATTNNPNPNNHPPSSFPSGSFRDTPSPGTNSRSRSRSRGAPSEGPGPTRTRVRRHNSVSSISPPPTAIGHARPGIVIPHHHHHRNGHGSMNGMSMQAMAGAAAAAGGAGWGLVPGQGQQQEYLPDGLSGHSHHGHAHSIHHLPSQQQHASYFGLSPPQSAHDHILTHHTSSPTLHQHPHTHHQLTHHASTGSLDGEPGSAVDKQTLIANEKRRRRRESHNAVERRRRDNINEKISELATLIPECMLDPSANTPLTPADDQAILNGNGPMLSPTSTGPGTAASPPSSSAMVKEERDDPLPSAGQSQEAAGVVKANKGMILRKSVEYIRYLQQLVNVQASRNRELETELNTYRNPSQHQHHNHHHSQQQHTSGLLSHDSSSLDPALNPNAPNPDEMMLHDDVTLSAGWYPVGLGELGSMQEESVGVGGTHGPDEMMLESGSLIDSGKSIGRVGEERGRRRLREKGKEGKEGKDSKDGMDGP